MNRRRFFVSVLFSLASFAATAASKVETTGACTNTEIADADAGNTATAGPPRRWRFRALVRAVDAQSHSSKEWRQRAGYGSIANGTFVGVIIFTGKGGDFRGQAIKPGAYTLRFQTIPSDGNH